MASSLPQCSAFLWHSRAPLRLAPLSSRRVFPPAPLRGLAALRCHEHSRSCAPMHSCVPCKGLAPSHESPYLNCFSQFRFLSPFALPVKDSCPRASPHNGALMLGFISLIKAYRYVFPKYENVPYAQHLHAAERESRLARSPPSRPSAEFDSLLEIRGFEPLTYGLQSRRSSQLSYIPMLPLAPLLEDAFLFQGWRSKTGRHRSLE